jgi:hypothetical protein
LRRFYVGKEEQSEVNWVLMFAYVGEVKQSFEKEETANVFQPVILLRIVFVRLRIISIQSGAAKRRLASLQNH